ncbi:5-formyltetrahydrofolate cyclo-ligase [Oceanihabitans sediminis]|uniref:5-formyltetrahydrofolate cyclo-ligase n=1 Tax=Oceanihabitans sediminis TaxID=1812012 RepID=A0A368P7H9_9FLAO|nr:5-formyltetrahydrofolate cyclo-ligase [Oceanihabitans sediminis]MDX1773152.1 5-formyltetrahydrofolate cyclo-ligase [Oceanihabitans sediminis]RBP34844.1 5-formyltetrahydrofolate cyclo-ligase [Oceanihabitans sediminis]RCU58488.1 5-formyltetrahydrofolate cyclo-ligase [Oceanihabitans sediminis]
MTKAELRIAYRLKRKKLSPSKVDDYSLQIANQLLNLDIWSHSFYHVFLSIVQQEEVNTDYILNILSGKDKNIVISKSDFKTGLLQNFLLTDNTVIKKNKYNIPEPVDGIPIAAESIEVVFVPLLAFDNKGNRVGYGKGFYDRFLSDCKPETIKIGLSFFEAEPLISDIYEKDIPLDYCVTPMKAYTF